MRRKRMGSKREESRNREKQTPPPRPRDLGGGVARPSGPSASLFLGWPEGAPAPCGPGSRAEGRLSTTWGPAPPWLVNESTLQPSALPPARPAPGPRPLGPN